MEKSNQESSIEQTHTTPTNAYKVKVDNSSDKYFQIKVYVLGVYEFDGVRDLKGCRESKWYDYNTPHIKLSFSDGVSDLIFTDIVVFIDDYKSIHYYKFNNINIKKTDFEKLSITSGRTHPVVVIINQQNDIIKANDYKIREKCGWVGGLAGVNWIRFEFGSITYSPNYNASYCALI